MRTFLASFGYICFVYCSQAGAQTSARGHALIELRPARMTPAAGYPLVKSVADTSFYLTDTALVSDDDIADARTDTSALNGLVLEVRLKPAAASRLHEFTQHHIGERLAVLLNGELSGTPALIVDPVSNGGLELGGLPPGNAQRFAAAVAARWHSRP